MLLQTVFDQWGKQIKEAWEAMDPVEVWGWILLSIGIICVMLFIIFTEYKRPERDSIKFSVIIILFAAVFMGIGLDMILMANGIW